MGLALPPLLNAQPRPLAVRRARCRLGSLLVAGATVSTSAGVMIDLCLHDTGDHLESPVPVILLNGRRKWAEMASVERAHGLDLTRSRRGRITRAHCTERTTAYVSADGAAFMQQLPEAGRKVWALTGVRGSYDPR